MENKIIHNGRLSDASEALFSLEDVDVTYGYGCYETLKVRDGFLYFPEFHVERLLNSAAILGIAHTLDARAIREGLELLVRSYGAGDYNVKILLIGHDDRPADWFAITLAALHPPAGSEETGVPCLAFHGERHFPQAKSLSMLLSTVAYRKAASLGCYDALLVNRRNEITEGTRTNVFFAYISDPRVILTPCFKDVLSGITRKTFIQALEETGWECREAPLALDAVREGRCALMVSSTSTRLVPVCSLAFADGNEGFSPAIDSGKPGAVETIRLPILPELKEAAVLYGQWLERYARKETSGYA